MTGSKVKVPVPSGKQHGSTKAKKSKKSRGGAKASSLGGGIFGSVGGGEPPNGGAIQLKADSRGAVVLG